MNVCGESERDCGRSCDAQEMDEAWNVGRLEGAFLGVCFWRRIMPTELGWPCAFATGTKAVPIVHHHGALRIRGGRKSSAFEHVV